MNKLQDIENGVQDYHEQQHDKDCAQKEEDLINQEIEDEYREEMRQEILMPMRAPDKPYWAEGE